MKKLSCVYNVAGSFNNSRFSEVMEQHKEQGIKNDFDVLA